MSADTRARLTEPPALDGAKREPFRSADELLEEVYDELRRIAASYLKRERPGHTLQPTAVVHEAYLKLADQTRVEWKGRTHLLAVAAQAMRRLLIDHARGRGREKRGGSWQRVTLCDEATPGGSVDLSREELIALHVALDELAELDARQAWIVELRYFSGMKVDEVAELLGVSKRTVENHWVHARAWLRRALNRGESP